MATEKEIVSISKFLSLVLRHQPELIGLTLSHEGWADIDELLALAAKHGQIITKDTLNVVVDTNSKKRFAFSDDRQYIRASQGHSVEVSLGYQPQTPPEILYHGTAVQSVNSILAMGLHKQKRQHVHLSTDMDTATKVGQRHGKPAILEVLTGDMHRQGYSFFLSENGVWLTDHVPPAFIKPL
ncbi:RNA 2'-phosphotransferase [Mucilaginibacter sp. CSA2-8R]|uniref:RNA 2'-phosphotransferase n=1 Tax=Mucilaginibacter sp. CSA2-8R TaxID=3141542 RepID=UPI00315D0F09